MAAALPDETVCPVCGKEESVCDHVKMRCPKHGLTHASWGSGNYVGDEPLEVLNCGNCGSHEAGCRCQRCQVPRSRDAVLKWLFDLDQRGARAKDVTEFAGCLYDSADHPFTEQETRAALAWLCEQGYATGDRGHQGSVVLRPRITPAGRLYATPPAIY